MMMPLSKDIGSEERGSEDIYKGFHLRCFFFLFLVCIQWSDKLWLEIVEQYFAASNSNK